MASDDKIWTNSYSYIHNTNNTPPEVEIFSIYLRKARLKNDRPVKSSAAGNKWTIFHTMYNAVYNGSGRQGAKADSNIPDTAIGIHSIPGTGVQCELDLKDVSCMTDEEWLYSSNASSMSNILHNPVLTLKTNEPDELTFDVVYDTPGEPWNKKYVAGIPLDPTMKFSCIVVRSNIHGIIFEGRPIKFTRDVYNTVSFTCEGCLAYLYDVPKFPERFYLTAMDGQTSRDSVTGKKTIPIFKENGEYDRDTYGNIKVKQIDSPYDEYLNIGLNQYSRSTALFWHIIMTNYNCVLYYYADRALAKGMRSYWFENHMFYPHGFIAAFRIEEGKEKDNPDNIQDFAKASGVGSRFSNTYADEYKNNGGISGEAYDNDKIANYYAYMEDQSYIDYESVGTVYDCLKQIVDDCNGTIHIDYNSLFILKDKRRPDGTWTTKTIQEGDSLDDYINKKGISVWSDWNYPSNDEIEIVAGDNMTDFSVSADYSSYANLIMPYGNEIDAEIASDGVADNVEIRRPSQYLTPSMSEADGFGTRMPNGMMVYTTPDLKSIEDDSKNFADTGKVKVESFFGAQTNIGKGNYGFITNTYNIDTDSQQVLDYNAKTNVRQQVWNKEDIEITGVAKYCYHTAIHVYSKFHGVDGMFNVTEQTINMDNLAKSTVTCSMSKRDVIKDNLKAMLNDSQSGKVTKSKRKVGELQKEMFNILY